MSGGELWSKFSFDTMESGGGRMHEGEWALNDNMAKLGGGQILEWGRFEVQVQYILYAVFINIRKQIY